MKVQIVGRRWWSEGGMVRSLIIVAVVAGSAVEGSGNESAGIESLCSEVQLAVAAVAGLPAGRPVPVFVRTRAEIRRHIRDTIDLEYPDQELQRRGRCFGELGLLPRDYDLADGLVAFLDEQAGGYYDPRTNRLIWVTDLPAQLQSEPVQRLIAGHELMHALQDRRYDLVTWGLEELRNLDAGYGRVAAIEGTAMVAGFAVMQGASTRDLGDLGPMLRAGYEDGNAGLEVYSTSPTYLQERMIGPYIDGSTWVHAVLEHQPGVTLASLLERLPVSAEQVLHFDRYIEGDTPSEVDLSWVRAELPDGWTVFYANTLGEFEVRTLCLSHPETRARAAEVAAGWDGMKVVALGRDSESTVVVIAGSVWDSEPDAVEFAESMAAILPKIHAEGTFEIRTSSVRVAFVTGMADADLRSAILDRLTGPAAAGPPVGSWRAQLSTPTVLNSKGGIE